MGRTKELLAERGEFDQSENDEDDDADRYDPVVQAQVNRVIHALQNLNRERFERLMHGTSLFP